MESTIPPEIDEGPATVLLVDDSPTSVTMTKQWIEALGHRVVVATSWTQAIQYFTTMTVDLVLMDAVMPTVDGFRLTHILRQRSTSYVPIVFLTGLTSKEARERSIQVGADDLLTKPVDPIELRLRVVAMLRIRRLTRALEEKSGALEKLARRDVLTGLFNRRELNRDLPKVFSRTAKNNIALHALMLDIDHFKNINDQHGHQVGDDVLECLGTVVQDALERRDKGYRYGGEEVCILASDLTIEGAVELAERVRLTFSAKTSTQHPAGRQTLSVGVASTVQGETPEDSVELLSFADRALYAAKAGGRNRVVNYSELG